MLLITHDPDDDIRRIEMPEYLAPGVYVEEARFRNKSIAGEYLHNRFCRVCAQRPNVGHA
jgi:hypothetical protein